MATIRFDAAIITIKDWLILKLPLSASSQLPSRSQVMVSGTMNDFRFTAPLEPDGRGGHWLHIDAHLLKSGKVTAGDKVQLAIEPTKVWLEPDIPADWNTALDTDPQVRDLWTNITPMARWEWLRWINSTNQPGTRQRRIEVSCSKLLAGERRPCCFNRSMCCVPDVSKNGVLLV